MDAAWLALPVALAVVLRAALRDVLALAVLQRTNYAGRAVATAGGIVAVVAFVCAMAVWTVFDAEAARRHVPAVVAVTGFAAVGLLDDVVGTQLARGIRGHVRAAARGQLTSGAVKLIAGGAVALVAVVPYRLDTAGHLLAAIVVAGAANAANLFDLRPARLAKVAIPTALWLAVVAGSVAAVLGPLMFVVAVAALVPDELRETLMLGDTGANPLGAAVGLLAVACAADDRAWLWTAAAIAVAVNLAGELVSFSRVIERVGPLRVLDRLGRRP